MDICKAPRLPMVKAKIAAKAHHKARPKKKSVKSMNPKSMGSKRKLSRMGKERKRGVHVARGLSEGTV